MMVSLVVHSTKAEQNNYVMCGQRVLVELPYQPVGDDWQGILEGSSTPYKSIIYRMNCACTGKMPNSECKNASRSNISKYANVGL